MSQNEIEAPMQTAELVFRAGPVSGDLRLQVTPSGLLAVGGLVGCILLSTAVLVWSATSVRRKHPIAAAIAR